MSKIMLSIPKEFLKEVNKISSEEHRNRSELIREALRKYMELKKSHERPIDNPIIQRSMQIQTKTAEKLHKYKFNSTDVIREMREERFGVRR